ncbi:hypothetical protein FVF58_47735 [Paraburkholderia panacisoli]|uniref:Uncharacterized protein n=1 Tax=Paraburkholderia panacisoli TaxID=2603818 RepID=A0A5B0G2U4_9BURK|nr:hypothetical protein [Paraburkholderia panacisoli]KAA0997726.1 hypothetical protein FVF58_47735 [Paraburkholderia panacisoli]
MLCMLGFANTWNRTPARYHCPAFGPPSRIRTSYSGLAGFGLMAACFQLTLSFNWKDNVSLSLLLESGEYRSGLNGRNLRKRALMKVGTPPELIDPASQPEFATSVVTSNTLMSKRVMQLQDEFHPQLAAHMRILVMNTAETMADLKQILRDNFTKIKVSKEDRQDARRWSNHRPDRKAEVPVVTDRPVGDKNVGEEQKEYLVEQILVEFLMNVEVSLPRPNSSTLEIRSQRSRPTPRRLRQGWRRGPLKSSSTWIRLATWPRRSKP